MELLKLIKNRISTEWKKTFNDNVDILNGITRNQDQKINVVDKRIDNLVLHSGGESSNEVVDARVNNKGETFDTLESRLLAAENTHDTDIEQSNTQISENKEQLSQLNEIVRMLYNSAGSNISIYVSGNQGSDISGDGTQEKPFKTIQMAVNQIPLINRSVTTIFIDEGTYLEDVRFSNCSANQIYIRPIQSVSSIDITKSDLPVKVRSIAFYYCSGYLRIQGIQFVDQVNQAGAVRKKYSILCEQGGYLSVDKCLFKENVKNLEHQTLYVGGQAKLANFNSYFLNQNTIGIANAMADMLIFQALGSGNSIGVISQNSIVRVDNISTVSTVATKTIECGLILTKGTVLS